MEVDAYVFTGIAGLRKQTILSHLRKYVLIDYMHEPTLKGLDDREFERQAKYIIPIIEFCGLAQRQLEVELVSLGSIYEAHCQRFRERLAELEKDNFPRIRCVFIHTHMSNVIFGHYRSWLTEQALRDAFNGLNIRCIINLIDNVHVCRHLIRAKEYPYTLDQIITWRDIEQMVTEMFTSRVFPDEPVYRRCKVFSVNHCLKTMADLLFDENKSHLYTAYAISKIRDLERLYSVFQDLSIEDVNEKISKDDISLDDEDKELLEKLSEEFSKKNLLEIRDELKDQNLHFRNYFGNAFVTYDPSTIDEIPILVKARNTQNETISIGPNDFWPARCSAQDRLAGRDIVEELGTVEIPVSEINELSVGRIGDRDKSWSSIERQVRSRDFRLIDQADGLVAYRPTLGGRWSKGVLAEVNHTRDVLRRPFFLIRDTTDGSVDLDGTLDRESGPRFFGEWDLSTPENREIAFEFAAEELRKQIEASEPSRIT